MANAVSADERPRMRSGFARNGWISAVGLRASEALRFDSYIRRSADASDRYHRINHAMGLGIPDDYEYIDPRLVKLFEILVPPLTL
jgi:hypothetical protein